jgi:hypothetical protein
VCLFIEGLKVREIAIALSAGFGMLALVACGSEPLEIPERIRTPIDPATVGTISGSVAFEGEMPILERIPMGGFPGCATQHEEDPVNESVLVSGGRLQNVFVYIQTGLEGMTFEVPTEPAVFDQTGCVYSPRVLGVQRFQPIVVRNSDPLLHNVHATPQAQTGFNFGQPVRGMENLVQFKENEVMVPVICDVHGWMRAYIGVVDHPYFAVTLEDGEFRLPDVPPGTYTLSAWHEVLGTHSAEVTLGEGEEVTVNFTFSG